MGAELNSTVIALNVKNNADQNRPELSNFTACSGICRPLIRILDQNKPLSKRFFELANRLNKFFSISKAVLVLSDNDDALKMMAVWEHARLREGVMLTIPPKNSLLHRAKGMRLIINRSIAEDFPPEYRGNFIESNILFDESTSSLAICPLFSEDVLSGVACLSSPAPFAFELIEKGYFDDIFGRLGEILAEENESIFI